MPDRNFFLSPKASKARLREAEQARNEPVGHYQSKLPWTGLAS